MPDEKTRSRLEAAYARGAGLFDAGAFFEAHEAWEAAWIVEDETRPAAHRTRLEAQRWILHTPYVDPNAPKMAAAPASKPSALRRLKGWFNGEEVDIPAQAAPAPAA